MVTRGLLQQLIESLSARRAWIEIGYLERRLSDCRVALRKESVDRNQMEANIIPIGVGSLSARRAWIEIRTHAGLRR